MPTIDDRLVAALRSCGSKPSNDADPGTKKNYNEKISAAVALAVAAELRARGMDGARPTGSGEAGVSGAERRLAGGIGAKKVDVTWATEESGLILAVSVKTILFKDARSQNFQKNLTNPASGSPQRGRHPAPTISLRGARSAAHLRCGGRARRHR